MLFIIHRENLLQLFSLHPMDQQVFSYCCSFLTITQSYHRKNTTVGTLHTEEIAEAVLLYISWIAFPTSPFTKYPEFRHTTLTWRGRKISCFKVLKVIIFNCTFYYLSSIVHCTVLFCSKMFYMSCTLLYFTLVYCGDKFGISDIARYRHFTKEVKDFHYNK